MRLCAILLTCLAWAAIGTPPTADAARWALVPVAAPAGQSTAGLLTVELSQWADVELVERAAIDRESSARIPGRSG